MDAEHATEITLDDALAVLETLMNRAMNTYESTRECARGFAGLVTRLGQLEGILASAHNVSGNRTRNALAALIEQAQLAAADAERLARNALAAAELAEAADRDLNDAYRPVQTATQDAGLTAPAARAHNDA
jgi:hypothetical protein